MDTEKTTAPAVTEDEKRTMNSVIYAMFCEYVSELETKTEAEKREENNELAYFSELEGVPKESGYTMMYAGFRAGVLKGLELVEEMERKA